MSQVFTLPKKDRDRMIVRIGEFLSSLPEKAYRIEITEHRRTRTVQQNRYLFGVAYPLLSDYTGYTVEDIHTYCCGRTFGWTTIKCPRTDNNPAGVKDVPVRTTTKDADGKHNVLSWADFWDFVADVQQLGAEAGVFIPDPDPELAAA